MIRKNLRVYIIKKVTNFRALMTAVVCLSALTLLLLLMSCGGYAQDQISRVLDFGAVTRGVRVSGVDLSGMTREEAFAATANIPGDVLNRITFSADIDGEVLNFTAGEMGVGTDYEDVMERAFSYGHTGTHSERAREAYAAGSGLVNFEVKARAEEQNVREAVTLLSERLDKPPVDASYIFMPTGYVKDGSAYSGIGEPVRLAKDSVNALKFQYYRTDGYVKNYIPADSDIARFMYSPEKSGRSADTETLAASVINAVAANDYSIITVPVRILEPAVKTEQVKRSTQLVSSWTSSYESHSNADRVYNVAKLSGLISGVVIAPGETWSINKQAGPRTYENGWKGAAGINDGAFVKEPGGGVCQVSSTLYNAALRAGLDVVESSRHSIISNYMPVGLDATISTGNKDLKLRNPYDTPVYIISYMNTKDKNVTVEIYGPPVVSEKYGEVILDFSSEVTGRTELPKTSVHYRAAQTPDGKPIDPGASKVFVSPRRGTTAQTYIHYISPDGKELGVEKFYTAKYPRIEGEKYVNDVPPS